MDPITLYLLRHGESELNARRIFAGRSVDPRLTPLGLEEAQSQALALRDVPFSAIYASPLLRARQTAAAVAAGRDLAISIDERLKEVDLGALDGLQINDLGNQANYRAVLTQWEAGQLDAGFAGGETLREVEQRFRSFLDEISRSAPDSPVLIVAHGILFMAALWLLAVNRGPTLNDVYMGRCHLTILDYQDGQIQIRQFNQAPPMYESPQESER